MKECVVAQFLLRHGVLSTSKSAFNFKLLNDLTSMIANDVQDFTINSNFGH